MLPLKGLSVLAGGIAIVVVVLAASGAVAEVDGDYHAARWDPIHFKPAIDSATDAQCLACHQEVLERRVRESSPAGVNASETLAWYQTLDTYAGEQETFHRRHLATGYARQVMNLRCNFCHQGNDPREETANSSADATSQRVQRKHVNPDVCLMCHGKFNYQVMGVPGEWAAHGEVFANNCLICHAAIRTTRHQVNYLNAEAIEEAAQQKTDVCYGCHGGRSWYRIHYPYPRHSWPGDGGVVPDWAKHRPTRSSPRFRIDADASAAQ